MGHHHEVLQDLRVRSVLRPDPDPAVVEGR
jgi:hypothetical protein